MFGPSQTTAHSGATIVAVPHLSLFTSLRGYQRGWLDGDVVAGLTVWAVLVPEALAYATIAGVSPVVGLYAAPPALVLYAAFGSSRHLSPARWRPRPRSPRPRSRTVREGCPATRTSSSPSPSSLALVTGVLALVAGLLRLGFLASFISEPVLKGFIIGLALTIMVGQLPKLFGVEKEDGNFFEQAWDFLAYLGDTQWRTLLVGVGSLALVLVLREVAPRVPGSLVAVILGVLLVELFDLDANGVDDRRRHRLRAAVLRAPRRHRLSDYLRDRRRRRRRDAGRLRRVPRRRQDLRHPEPLRDRPQPRAARARRGQPRCRAEQRHGRQRQPVEDGRQRVGGRPQPALRHRRARP